MIIFSLGCSAMWPHQLFSAAGCDSPNYAGWSSTVGFFSLPERQLFPDSISWFLLFFFPSKFLQQIILFTTLVMGSVCLKLVATEAPTINYTKENLYMYICAGYPHHKQKQRFNFTSTSTSIELHMTR